MIEFCAEYPFMQLPIKNYTGFAYDGRFTYLTSSDRHIAVCDENNVLIKVMQASRFYHTLCYDPGTDCFWAASNQDSPGILYCLSHEMEEKEKIIIEGYHGGVMQGLAYVQHNNSLIFFDQEQIYQVNRKGEIRKTEKNQNHQGDTVGICALEQGILCLSAKQSHHYISFFLDQDMWFEEILLRDTQAKAMVVFPDKNQEEFAWIRIFVVKYGRKPCLLTYKFDTKFHHTQFQVEKHSCADSEECNLECNAINSCCPKQYSDKPCCPAACLPPPCDETICCPEHCKPIECCTEDCCENYAKVLESIALVEASIAHILNAEGEKLQKVIHDDANICELLAVNASVQKTILHATHLEHTLYGKLEALLQIDCKTCPTPCPKPCPTPCPKPCKSKKCNRQSIENEPNEAENGRIE